MQPRNGLAEVLVPASIPCQQDRALDSSPQLGADHGLEPTLASQALELDGAIEVIDIGKGYRFEPRLTRPVHDLREAHGTREKRVVTS
jgi:hypothetical protein